MCWSSMSRRSFTLIELMVSIVLTVIVVFFLYKALAMQEKANESLQKKGKIIAKSNQLFELLYRDFKESNSSEVVNTFNKNYNIFSLTTTNSLHELPFAYVIYYVNAKDKTLVRLESSLPLHLPVSLEKVPFVFADVLLKNVKKFRIFPGYLTLESKESKRELLPGEIPRKTKKQKRNYLFYFQTNSKNVFFELE